MNQPRTHFILAAVALLLCSTAAAEDDLWFGIKAGTLGVGVEATWRPVPLFDLRAGYNRLDYDDDGAQAGIEYDATLELRTTYATANLLFPVSPMRLTAGAFANDNRLVLQSVDQPAYTVGGSSYTPDQVGTLRSTAAFDSPSPYLGIGFDFELAGRLGLNLDLGVLWQDSPVVTLTSDGSLANDPQFQQALETERRELEQETKDFKAWPVVSLGLNFNFF